MKKTVFVFNVQSLSDVITNSSSELFVFKDQNSVEEVKSLLDSICDNWRDEYSDPITIKELSFDDFEEYLYRTNAFGYTAEHIELLRKNGISSRWSYDFDVDKAEFIKDWNLENSAAKALCDEIGIAPDRAFENWNVFNPFDKCDTTKTGSELQKEVDRHMACLDLKATDEFYFVAKRSDKYKNLIFLFSLDENPSTTYQDKIETVAERIHLG